MKQVTIINRYADRITFTQEGNTVVMSGYEGDYLRSSRDSNGQVLMVDPSGGPYVAVGDDLNEYFRDKVSRIVESIEINPGLVKFKIKS